jgi:hypothetical protein
MKRRPLLSVIAAGAAGAIVIATVALSAPASATTPATTGSTAYSAAGGTGSATLRANLQLSGSLGGLLDGLISPVLNSALNPLLAALQANVNSTVSSVLGTSSSLNATTPTQQAGPAAGTFPNETAPSPCNAAAAEPCYTAVSSSIAAAPLLTASIGALTGWTQQIPAATDATNPMYGRARVASASVSVLPGIVSLTSPLVSTGEVDSKSNCPNDGTSGATKPKTAPSASVSASTVSALGGLITLNVLNGQIGSLVVNGTSYASLSALPNLTINGVTVQQYGTAVLAQISLTPTQLLNALGLASGVVTQLLSYAPTSSVVLSVIVGPGSNVTTKNASAWGLGIGVDLSGSLAFNLLGLVTANLNIPTGVGSGNTGNLLDLRLAYTSCQSAPIQGGGGGTGGSTTTPAIPPALV